MALATKEVTRRELLERWSVIEQQEEEDASPSLHHPVRRRRIPLLKEQWFSDAFSFLIYLPKESHIWCGYWDLMGPLLETFYNYFKDQTQDSPLKMLWNRITGEMKRCTLCIHRHHQAKEMYATEYEQICIRPLLDVLCILDEQRISQHLKDLNARIARGEYDMERDYQEVVCVMFEVLMFPILLDDLSLDLEFESFIEAVDNTHELTLDENQHYLGVYCLLFSKSRRVRSIGHRLAGRMGKLRRSGDLDPLQYLLKKCIYVLETELRDSVTETSRPRVQPDRTTVWLGMKSFQLQAISVAVGPFDLMNFELTLIQGPPGTGKTRTIVGIVSGLLACFQLIDFKRSRSGGRISSDSTRIKPRISESAAIARAWQDAALARLLNDVAKYNSESTEGCTRGRILICAQSNAAVDELVARICSEGLYGCNGESYRPYLVRDGNPKNSIPYFLDTLVEDRLTKEKDTYDKKYSESFLDSLNSTRANLEKLVEQIRYYEAMRASSETGDTEPKNLEEVDCGETNLLSDTEMKVKLRQLYAKKKAIYAELAHAQARERKASEEIRGLRQKFRTTILKEAEIVVTTLSGSGGDLYGVCSEWASSHKFSNESGSTLFDAVVIDEAAQALEPATLIPLRLLKSKGTRCIMVGDPKQLPATVLSSVASKCLFQCSMFERLQKAGHPVIMLTQQDDQPFKHAALEQAFAGNAGEHCGWELLWVTNLIQRGSGY